jgi:Ser/Thr protein kinase RdoA (MazF antagonist)
MKIDSKVRNSFIQGYQNIRQLSEVEYASILIFVKVAHIWVMGISASVVEDNDYWLNGRLELLRYLD